MLKNGEGLPTGYTWLRQPDMGFFCVSEKCAISACHILYIYFIDFEEHHKIIKPLDEKHMSFYMKLSSLLS